MLKKITLLTVFFAFLATASTQAQTSATASQTVQIQIPSTIELITNTIIDILQKEKKKKKKEGNNGNSQGRYAGPGQNDEDDDLYGAYQQFTVRSNKEFIVSVQAKEVKGNDVLLALANNKTGGVANPNFQSNYAPVSATAQDLLMNCAYGEERSFSVNYKTKNNKAKEQRITKADIIYTATLP
jgi:hypothetical protein